ncbi:hypothetical protein M0805_003891 [Coniferiporia weirii]|nr:hypothetical protein M0805_003891 [Coniferiporia weirii]
MKNLFKPYPNKPQTSGCMRIDLEVIYELVPKFNGTAVRPRIEQGQIIRPGPEDVVRLAKLGVIASVQPSHAMLYAQGRLEPPVERIKDLHAFQTIIDAEERVTLGSGSPAEDMNPFAVFHAAITRAAPDDSSLHESERWFREQYLTRVEALRSMTINPAYASFSEKELGSLEPGKIADYVVISQDIMTIAEDEVLDTKVLATVLDGELASGHI